MKTKTKLMKELKMNEIFQTDDWSEANRKFFDGLAKKYDAGNILHSFGTKSKMDKEAINHLHLPKGAHVLDCATGSGDIAIEISRRDPSAKIKALDASEKMLEIARDKIAKQALENIELTHGDILKLPYPDNHFDAVIISYGLRNLVDYKKGLKEIFRVLKPGGLFSNIDQGKPQNPFFKAFYKIYFYHVAPLIGKLVFHIGEFNSFRYLPESNKYFPSPSELVKSMEELGLDNIEVYSYWMGAVSQQIGKLK